MDHADPPAAPAGSRDGMPHALARAIGDYGERLAERYLREQGWEILDRQWRCRAGEIDLVARDGRCLVICEVKTRRGAGFGSPIEGVGIAKVGRLRRLAAHWLAEHAGVECDDVRVDVVGVHRPRTGPCVLEHLQGVG